MFFTSYQFVLFILILMLLYYTLPKRFQWIILLAGSYIFYAFSGIDNLIYFLSTTVSTYIASMKLMKLKEEQKNYLKDNKDALTRQDKKEYKNKMKKKQWNILLVCLLFNFGVLAVVKYTNFMIGNINGIIGIFNGQPLSFINIALPLGISFYTFQTMGYIIDVYRETCKTQENIFKLALFTSFFPQLIQGPISRYNDISETLDQEHSFNLREVNFGLQRVLWGYFKKLVIADRLLVAVNT